MKTASLFILATAMFCGREGAVNTFNEFAPQIIRVHRSLHRSTSLERGDRKLGMQILMVNDI